jgi:hypothetical protein
MASHGSGCLVHLLLNSLFLISLNGWIFYNSPNDLHLYQSLFALVPSSVTLCFLVLAELAKLCCKGNAFNKYINTWFMHIYTFVGLPLTMVHVFNVICGSFLYWTKNDFVYMILMRDALVGYTCMAVLILNLMALLSLPAFRRCTVYFTPSFSLLILGTLFCGVVIDRVFTPQKESVPNNFKFLICLGTQTALVAVAYIFASWYALKCASLYDEDNDDLKCDSEDEVDCCQCYTAMYREPLSVRADEVKIRYPTQDMETQKSVDQKDSACQADKSFVV